jgi:hypothetical protein
MKFWLIAIAIAGMVYAFGMASIIAAIKWVFLAGVCFLFYLYLLAGLVYHAIA